MALTITLLSSILAIGTTMLVVLYYDTPANRWRRKQSSLGLKDDEVYPDNDQHRFV